MAREPNQTEARGIWDVTRPNQQRNAIYGERWPLTYVPPPPAPDVLFTRQTQYGWGPAYSGTNNTTGANFVPQTSANPSWTGWGMGSGQYASGLGFMVSGGGGTYSQFTLDWIYLPTIYAGQSNTLPQVQFEIRICNGLTAATGSRVYENYEYNWSPNPAINYNFKPYNLPATGNVYGSTLLNFNTQYQLTWHNVQGLVNGSSWLGGWGNVHANYMSANQQTHNVSFSGQTYSMTWYDPQNINQWYSSGTWLTNIGTGTWGGTMGSGWAVTFS